MILTPNAVDALVVEALFRPEELVDGEAPVELAVSVECITSTFVFHKTRLEALKPQVQVLLDQLHKNFRMSIGGGWSFDNLSMTGPHSEDGERVWGEQINAQALMAMAMGLDLMVIVTPKWMWDSMPGGVPYLATR